MGTFKLQQEVKTDDRKVALQKALTFHRGKKAVAKNWSKKVPLIEEPKRGLMFADNQLKDPGPVTEPEPLLGTPRVSQGVPLD